MATINISLSPTQTQYVLDYTTLVFNEEGEATVNITLPNSETFKAQYLNRVIPDVTMVFLGELSRGQKVTINVTGNGTQVNFLDELTFEFEGGGILPTNSNLIYKVVDSTLGWYVWVGGVVTRL